MSPATTSTLEENSAAAFARSRARTRTGTFCRSSKRTINAPVPLVPPTTNTIELFLRVTFCCPTGLEARKHERLTAGARSFRAAALLPITADSIDGGTIPNAVRRLLDFDLANEFPGFEINDAHRFIIGKSHEGGLAIRRDVDAARRAE